MPAFAAEDASSVPMMVASGSIPVIAALAIVAGIPQGAVALVQALQDRAALLMQKLSGQHGEHLVLRELGQLII